MKRMKISREGIVLIKSFEGFRPRAVQREDGGWVIGYGHTLSAREGASVSEADAELLLQYDLLPVAQAVNDGVEGRVNQHQFDALASFVFSVGVDRFNSSDVLERIRAGFSGEAADAMVGWPEPTAPEAALRRRAAERALFVADPAAPVALADLLAAPLPPPPTPPTPAPPGADPAQPEALGDETLGAEPLSTETTDAETLDAEPETVVTDSPAAFVAPLINQVATPTVPEDARAAAVAHLLATPAETVSQDAVPGSDAAQSSAEALVPAGNQTQAGTMVEPANDRAEAEFDGDAPDTSAAGAADAQASAEVDPTQEPPAETESAPTIDAQASSPASAPNSERSEDPEPVEPSTDPSAAEAVAIPAVTEPAGRVPDPSPMTFSTGIARYLPYGGGIGPLPGLTPVPAPQPAARVIDFAEPDASTPTPPALRAFPDLADDLAAPVIVPAFRTDLEVPGTVDPLVLTPEAEGTFTSTSRLVWPENRRDGDDAAQSPLFDEDAILHRTLGPVVRPEFTDKGPSRFNWGETGAYLLMGGFGLVSFGMGMAAFRLAAQQSSGSNETTMIGGVLTLIAIACVGVSTYNLYRRWGRTDEN